jgi:hypothetical protein
MVAGYHALDRLVYKKRPTVDVRIPRVAGSPSDDLEGGEGADVGEQAYQERPRAEPGA